MHAGSAAQAAVHTSRLTLAVAVLASVAEAVAEELLPAGMSDRTCLHRNRQHAACPMSTAVFVLSKALKAGSTLPPLANNTALTTLMSMLGKASIKVASARAWGLMGRGGFGGGASSSWKLTLGLGLGEGDAAVSRTAVAPVSCGSSSKSSGRAVVGDSAPVAELVLEVWRSSYQKVSEDRTRQGGVADAQVSP